MPKLNKSGLTRASGLQAGNRFGKLVLVRRATGVDMRNAHWVCQCDCGSAEVVRRADNLRSGHTVCCGCTGLLVGKRVFGTTVYKVWTGMIQRCVNPKAPGWPYYGARGIKVCDRWLHSFENFKADMGEKPSPTHSIDRIDNNGDYEPGNCRWATRREQRVNTRPRYTVKPREKAFAYVAAPHPVNEREK